MSAKAVTSKEIGESDIAGNVYVAPGGRDRYSPCAGLVIPQTIVPRGHPRLETKMHHFLRHFPLLALAACATGLPEGQTRTLATAGIGCEGATYGMQARAVAIYTRVIADRVCVLDASGRCQPQVDSRQSVSAEVRLPQSRNAAAADALRQELGRRGILARIARPRGPKMYASLGPERGDNGLLVLELSEIVISDEGDVAHVMVRASRTTDVNDGLAGDLVRLVRARACWRLERSASSALAD